MIFQLYHMFKIKKTLRADPIRLKFIKYYNEDYKNDTIYEDIEGHKYYLAVSHTSSGVTYKLYDYRDDNIHDNLNGSFVLDHPAITIIQY